MAAGCAGSLNQRPDSGIYLGMAHAVYQKSRRSSFGGTSQQTNGCDSQRRRNRRPGRKAPEDRPAPQSGESGCSLRQDRRASSGRRPYPGRDSRIRRVRDCALMVIDTSVLIAIALGEPSRDRLLDALETAVDRVLSSVSLLETGMVLRARLGERAL